MPLKPTSGKNSKDSEYAERRNALAILLRQERVDALLVTALPNIRYLTGFTGSNAILIAAGERSILFTDPRYATQAPREADCDVVIAKGNLTGKVAARVKRRRFKTVGFEQNRVSFQDFEELKRNLSGVRLKPVSGSVEILRTIKSEAEIATIRTSVQLNSAALEQALEHFNAGMSEQDLAAEIDYRMRLLGAERNAFETIVASGERSALPHAHPTDHSIENNQLLLIDMGASVAGYASDMTRTLALGELSPGNRRMYKAVLESQLAAANVVKPGISCAQVDRAARNVLRGYGLEKLFVHSTGHGLGLEIHERPRIGRNESMKLEAGMVITIEPGVYREGFGGVRIEDTLVVTERGCETLTPTGKELVIL